MSLFIGLGWSKTLPPNFLPSSKWYHVETIWLHVESKERNQVGEVCYTVDQLGDLFSKGLPRNQLMCSDRELFGSAIGKPDILLY
jgi:glycine cleavage system H lipoate-binding protein